MNNEIYKIEKLHSTLDNGTLVSEMINETILSFAKEKSYILLHMVNKVTTGFCNNGQIILFEADSIVPTGLLHVRVFNSKGELYIWQAENSLYYRIRQDGKVIFEENDTTDLYIYDEVRKIWGTISKPSANCWTVLINESRGTNISVPFSREDLLLTGIKSGNLPLFIRVRNYYSASAPRQNSEGILKLIDARLCGFCNDSGIIYHSTLV